MRKLYFLWILSLSLITACTTEKVDTEGKEQLEVTPGTPIISFSNNLSNSSGNAEGPHRISYQNYPLTKALQELSEHPVKVPDNLPRLLSVNYYFPKTSLTEARQICMSAIADSLTLQIDTINQEYFTYQLSTQNDIKQDSTTSVESYFSRVGSEITIKHSSLEVISNYLKDNTNLLFIPKSSPMSSCCFSLTIDTKQTKEALLERLIRQGFAVEEGYQDMQTIRLSEKL